MDQLGDELKKIIKAGVGVVASGLEMGQDALDNLAQKGEPLIQQAKSAVTDAAGRVAQAMNDGLQAISCKPQVSDVIDLLRGMTREDWAKVRQALDELEAQADECDRAALDAAEAARDILNRAENEKPRSNGAPAEGQGGSAEEEPERKEEE